MERKKLGHTDLEVSRFCLGTMTWGTQNTVEDACDQIAACEDAGINFMDTAEMYPTTPISKATQGDTERVIGEWVRRGGNRHQWIIATKVTGQGYPHVRNGAPISAQTMTEAFEASLRSMNTDYIDVYQLHWPNRGSYMFRQNWHFDPSGQDTEATFQHMEEVLIWADKMIQSGKLRAIALSNESCWGTLQWLRLAKERGLPRVVSVQNEYSLMCRLYDTDMAEMTHHENVGLLAFSPLATGLLTGKYRNGIVPKGSRFEIQGQAAPRNKTGAHDAVEAYAKIAEDHEISMTQLAMAFCLTRQFITSAIFGATTMAQLAEILSACDLTLSKECLRDIAKAHKAYPMPF